MAELVSARSYRSTQGEARSLNCAGHPSPPMTGSFTLRFSGTATSPHSTSTASRSELRRILLAHRSRVMAPSGGFCGDVSSGPSDNWVSPDGAFLYQIYGNASKLVGYATKLDGSLEEVTSVAIPYNSPEGLAGF